MIDDADKDWLRPTPAFIARIAACLWDMVVLLLIALAIAALIKANEASAHDEPRQPPAMRLQTDPVNPPRCPKRNAEGALLDTSFASLADSGEWTHECWYSPDTLKGTP